MDRETIDRSQALADTVPFYGEGDPIPEDRDLSAKDDTSGILAVATLLVRCWPYIAPLILGRWWVPGVGTEDRMAELIRGRGYSFAYMPPLVTLLAVIGPYYGFVPTSLEYPFNLFYGLVAAVVICTWPLPHLSGRVQVVSLVVLVVSTILANMVAVVLIEGSAHSYYMWVITVACLLGWVVQLRFGPGVKYRVRVGTHFVYLYGLATIRGLGYMLIGLLTAEIINQSLLQNEPLMPGLAAMIGYPEMASGVADTLTQAQRMELRWVPIKAEFALFLLLWPLELALGYYYAWISQRINHFLRLALVDRWHRLSLRHHADHRVGDSIWRIQSDSETVTQVLEQVSTIVFASFRIVFALVLVSILSPILGAISVLFVVPTLILARWAMPRFRTRSLVERMANADLTSRVQESFKSIKLTKAYQAGSRSQTKFEDDSMIAFNAEYRRTRLNIRVGVIKDFYSELFIFSGMMLMAFWANSGDPTFATDLIALAGLSFVVWNLSAFRWASERHEQSIRSLDGMVMGAWGGVQNTAMGLKRVFDILDMEPEVTDRQDAIPFQGFDREVRFENVAFAYSSDRPVLDSISLTAVPGTITAIVGPTGSGKSTLMNLLLRLFDPDRGAISIDGHDLREFSVDSLRKNIAIALQENVLFGMTIRENIRYAVPDADDGRVNEALRVSCLDESVARLPKGLDTMLGDRGSRLSTGQRQRLSIARAIVRDTPILVLDEPTAALDADTEHRVLENLGVWAKDPNAANRAIFLITHRISTIRRADNIVYLDAGRVAESGDHETLMGIENGRYRAFVLAESGADAGENLDA